DQAGTERVLDSMRSGLRYVRSAPLVHCVLIRTGAFSVAASALLALLPILACLNVAAQTMSPPFMRARALSTYLLVLQGGMALGSAAWGALATKYGVPATMLCSSLALLLGLTTVRKYPLSSSELDLAPSVVRD